MPTRTRTLKSRSTAELEHAGEREAFELEHAGEREAFELARSSGTLRPSHGRWSMRLSIVPAAAAGCGKLSGCRLIGGSAMR
jgi:hypothetical protein